MAIDITKLSSDELFELARKRQQEEQSEAQRTALKERLAELKKMRGLIMSKHDEALASVEKAMAELQKKRAQLIGENEEALSGIDREMQELNAKLENAPAAAKPAAAPAPAPAPKTPEPVAPPPAETPAAASSSLARKATEATADEIMIHVRELMLGRSYISESLLKEQLRSRKVNVSNLHKQIEDLVREGKLTSKGGGNYALGKKA